MISFWYELQWQQPAWCLLALLPLLFASWTYRQRARLLDYAEPALRPWAIRETGSVQSPYRLVLQVLAWGLLGAALAGPYLPRWEQQLAEQVAWRDDVSIMVVMDVSFSMQQHDISPGRRKRAELELYDLLKRLRGERIGLIVYAEKAGLVTPATSDYAAFAYYLANSRQLLEVEQGKGLVEALSLAQQVLLQSATAEYSVLLVTSGEREQLNNNSAELLQQVKIFRQQNIALNILAMSAVDDNEASVDHRSLATLAEMSKGQFSKVSNGDTDWQTIYDNSIARLSNNKPRSLNSRAITHLYGWFLFPAIVLMLLNQLPSGRLSPLTAKAMLFGLLLVLICTPLYADEQQAFSAYQKGQYLEAQLAYAEIAGYQARMGEGASAYRRDDWQQAISSFSQALLVARSDTARADALYNMANSYYHNQQYQQAIDAYQGALQYSPTHQKAEHNLAYVQQRLFNQQATGNTRPATGAADDYGRYDESQTPDMPEENNVVEGKGRTAEAIANQAIVMGRQQAQATISQSASQRQLVISGEEIAISRKKLELVEDEDRQVIRTLIQHEQEKASSP